MAEKSNAQVALEAATRLAQAKAEKGAYGVNASSVRDDADAFLNWLKRNS